MIDIDDTHGFNLSLRGPVDISMYSRALFIKKAKCLKSSSILLIASLVEEKTQTSEEIHELLHKFVRERCAPSGSCHSK